MIDDENKLSEELDETLEGQNDGLVIIEEEIEDETIETDVDTEADDVEETEEIALHFGSDDDDDDENWWKNKGGYSEDERRQMEQSYLSTLRSFGESENEIVKGTVVAIGEKEVVINIGFKSEGVVQVSEFRDIPNLKPGDEVEVFVETFEDQDGQLSISRKRAKNLRSWEKINASLDQDLIITGHVMRRTKGGFVVDIEGIEAFLPGSQIDVKPVRDFDIYVGKTMEFKVVKINEAYENVVVSHKILIEAKLEEQRQQILANLDKGQVLEGTVKNMTSFGVFIDLGGVDGLLHITDISWGRINHPEEVLELDQKVNVVVLDFDDAKKRISLGMKQLTAHPWESLAADISEGAKVTGKVVTITDYGIFVEIVPGVEGLVHTSEMSWSQHAKPDLDKFKVGDEIQTMVLNIDRDERKMSLGIKQLKNDPWNDIEFKYPVNSRHNGLVRNLTNYGLFVELEEGVEGLVHISDLSWTKKFNHPSEFVKTDENLEVVVLDIDKEGRRLSLGHKQLTEDVWDTFASIFTVGSVHQGSVKKIDSKNATIELEYGVEGLCPIKQLKAKDGDAELKVEDNASFMVIEFNKDSKRLLLSHTRTWKEEPKPERRESTGGGQVATPASKPGGTTLGDFDALAKLKEQMEAEERKPKAKKAAAPVVEETEAEVSEEETTADE
jgi:small subunit ribosomal protein S1